MAALHLPALRAGLAEAGHRSPRCSSSSPGEATKGWAALERAVEWLIAEQVGRDDLVVAFGGGVIGDLAGFAAAVLRRGVGFVQIPTTLLAQVDSSVGGKTGINSRQGKNLVGAFHQPRLVLADTALLDTLPERDFLAGYAEVAKYGLLGDAGLLRLARGERRRRSRPATRRRGSHAVRRSCEMKAEIVARDETEQGDRALLNLGHTFGHALEAATGYSDRLLHGEAVAIGCLLAFELSRPARALPAGGAEPGRRALRGDGDEAAPRRHPRRRCPTPTALVALMGQDKKVRDGRLAFILARDIGEAFVARDVDLASVTAPARRCAWRERASAEARGDSVATGAEFVPRRGCVSKLWG